MNANSKIIGELVNTIEYIPVDRSYLGLNVLNDDHLNPTKLAEIINRDQSLVAHILAIANSPIYGLSRKISTIEMAISILGIKTIKDLVVGFTVFNSTYEKGDRYFLAEEFNQHSYMCGYVSQLLANDFNYPVKSEAFVAGLLHDIGIPIIHRYMNKEFKLISELKFYRRISQTKAEKLILGKTHCEVGGMVASKWNFPENLIDVIQNHHSPKESLINKKLSAIVHIADFIATKEAPQFLLSSEDEQLDESVVEILNIPDLSYLYDVINNVSELIKSVKILEDLKR
ncbi:MAG: HDOD domain-containing protein [Ignavibacteria bacterium]|jgi:putative nucleotidyltransferase with HDIG domain|nr:HDOD domain-containing protein [Ignavibacteria bacterium]MDH7526784.1 HDOD domain-containing protein [Ignavibacteria bacterium]